METPARFTFSPDGNTKVFPIPVTMKGDNYVRIDIDGVILNDRSKFDLVNNAVVFVNISDVPSGSQLDVLVVQTDEGISNLGNVNSVDLVASNITDVQTVAGNITSVNTTATNIAAVNTTATNIASVIDAVNQANAAAASAAAALVSENAAAASESAADASETAAAASAAASATSASSSASSASAALASKNAAAVSETNAANSATAAASSATSSVNSATASAASAAAALVSENASAASEVNAAASEAAAAISETNASASELAAAASEAAAAASEIAAASSEANAAISETAAASSASSASVSETAAAVSEANAAISETNAATSETNAAASETAAATSETNAASSATAAASSATAAASSATSAATSESNAATSAAAASNSQIAAAASAAAAANVYDTFDDRYLGSKSADPTLDNDGNPLAVGSLYFNNTANEMRVYDGGNWVAASAAGGVSLLQYEFTATAGQTTFSGTDGNGNTLSYTQNNIIVFLNGVALDDGGDYTASNGTSIVLTTGATAGDLLYIIAFKPFTSADMVSASNGGIFYNDITIQGNLTITGTVDGVDISGLASVATSGDYNDLINTPAPFDPNTLATVATTGSYTDLINIPANIVTDVAYVHTDNNYTTTEKNKLAGIEAGATADQTAAEILTAIKTVDGAGSGLDADTLDGNQASAFALASHTHDYVPERNRSDWNDGTVIGDVIGQMAWKNYGNNHTIFDASNSTSPDGTSINNTNPSVYWSGTYPTLMGWNGSNTYGVRVDVSRYSESAGNADTLDGQHGSYYYSPSNPPAASAPTTAQVGSATAGLAVGAVGSYGYFQLLAGGGNNTTTIYDPGFTTAGSNLRYSGSDIPQTTSQSLNISYYATAPAGTWRLMGYFRVTVSSSIRNTGPRFSLWLRIS